MTENNNRRFLREVFVLGFFIALGLTLAAYVLSTGVINFRLSGRYVTVKGLAEREVKADLAIWKIRFRSSGNDLLRTNAKIAEDVKIIEDFLKQFNLLADEIEFAAPRVIDLFAREYGFEKTPINRYIIEASLNVRTTKVNQIEMASQKAIELIHKGVQLDEGSYGANPAYLFTKLNDLRPEMLRDATKSARALAEQFAADSKSKVGSIKQAYQGTFTIGSFSHGDQDVGDERLTPKKRVRVVSTIDYFLVD